MNQFKIGDTVAVPVTVVFPQRKPARSRYGYDLGKVVATGKNKKNGKPAVKVKIITADSTWAKKLTKEPFFEKWALSADCDKI